MEELLLMSSSSWTGSFELAGNNRKRSIVCVSESMIIYVTSFMMELIDRLQNIVDGSVILLFALAV